MRHTVIIQKFIMHLKFANYVSAGTYYASVMGNAIDFRDKVVMDVGAGSGILSLFAAQVTCLSCATHALSTAFSKLSMGTQTKWRWLQAGAQMVYAVEASNMAASANILKNANPGEEAAEFTCCMCQKSMVQVPVAAACTSERR